MKKRNTSIVNKLIIYFLILNILTVVVIGTYSYFRAKDALVKRTFDQLTSLRIEKTYRIEQFFAKCIMDINLVSKSEDVHNMIRLIQNKGSNELLYKEYDKFLRKHFFSDKNYKRFFVAQNDGKVCFFSASENDSTILRHEKIENLPINNIWLKINNRKEVILEDYKIDEQTNQPTIFIGAPVFGNSENFIGLVAFEIDIEAINNIMFENNPHNGLGLSGESYLVGSDYLMRSTSRFQDNSVFKTKVQTEGVKKAINQETGNEIIKDYRNLDVLSSFGPVVIPGLNWTILAEIDKKEAMIPIDSIRNNILYLSILMSLLLFAFVYIIAKRISLPIVKLKHAAQKITNGNYDVFVKDIESNDEIASLIVAFNEMSGKIKTQTENLKLERSMRLSSMIDGQELERQRLSRELHDGLGQSILGIKMRLERTKNATPEKTKEIMEEVQNLFANTINEVRSISNNLMPTVLKDFGLVDALSNLCREVSESTGIEINFTCEHFDAEIEAKINTYLYRISQEALNNIIKHSRANLVYIDLESDQNKIKLSITDNGIGFIYLDNKKLCGNGISNMKERVHLLNGKIKISSTEEKGTTIEVNIPINHE